MGNKTRNTSNLVSDNNIFVDISNDRVGIGSTQPTTKLDVVGTVKATSFSGITTAMISDYGSGLAGGYSNTNVDNHINVGTANTGEVLSWNGSDYDWVVGVQTANINADTLNVSGVTTFNANVNFGNGSTLGPTVFNVNTSATMDGLTIQGGLTLSSNVVADFNGGLDVDGDTQLDDLTVAGVSTFQDDVNIGIGGAVAFFDISAGKVGVGTLPSGTSGKISLPTEKTPGGNDALISAGNQLTNYGLYVADDSDNANVNFRQQYVRQYTANHYTVSVGADKAFRVSNSDSFNTSALSAPGGMADDEVAFVVTPDTSTELRYNYNTKLETTGYGVTVTGGLNVSGVATASSFTGNLTGIASTATTVAATVDGTTASAYKIPYLNTTSNSSGNYELLLESGTFTYQPSNNTLTVSTISLNEIFVSNYIGLNDDDQIRIGSSNDARLFYDGTANDFEVTLGPAANKIAITDNGTYKHLITRDGKVGINTSVTPTVELDVNGDVNINGTLNISGVSTFSGDVNIGTAATTVDLPALRLKGNSAEQNFISNPSISIGGTTAGKWYDTFLVDGPNLQYVRHWANGFHINFSVPDDRIFVVSNTDGSSSVSPAGVVDGHIAFKINPETSTELRYNKVKKLETTNTGVVVTGILTATSFSGITTSMISDYGNGLAGGYSNTNVDTHLNTSTASSGEVLSWTGTDYDWVAQSGGGGGASNINGLSDGYSAGLSVGLGTGALANDDGTNNWNVAIGYSALNRNTSGLQNVAIGKDAMRGSETASANVYIGRQAGYKVSTAAQNVVIGDGAGYNQTTSSFSVLIGRGAGASLTDAGQQTLIGYYAGGSASITNSTAIGYNAGANSDSDKATYIGDRAGYHHDGDQNTFVGYRSGESGSGANVGTGNSNTGAGYYSLNNLTSGSKNTALGHNTGFGVTDGNSNVFLGYDSGSEQQGSENVIIGSGVTSANSATGDTQLAIGVGNSIWLRGDSSFNIYDKDGNQLNGAGSGGGFSPDAEENLVAGTCAGQNLNTTTYRNIFIGYHAGKGAASGFNGDENIYIGCGAGQCNEDGVLNIAIGSNAGKCITNGDRNIFLGCNAGRDNTIGLDNIFLGTCAGEVNVSGSCNVFLGHCVGTASTDGNYNIFLGSCAGYGNQSGCNNIIMGCQAAYAQGSYCCNIIIGACAGKDLTGNSNIFLGYEAGKKCGDGDKNIIIGDRAGCCLGSITSSSNILIGECAGKYITGISQAIMIGNGAGCAGAVYAGDCSIYIGYRAGSGTSQNGWQGILIGNCAGSNTGTSSAYNIALGNCAGRTTETGTQNNISIGSKAGYCISGSVSGNNISIGQCAGYCGSGSGNNIFIGCKSGYNTCYDSDGACNNVFLGASSGTEITTGRNNTFLGHATGCTTTDGSHNVAIGYGVTLSSSTASNEFKVGIGNTVWLRGDSSFNIYDKDGNQLNGSSSGGTTTTGSFTAIAGVAYTANTYTSSDFVTSEYTLFFEHTSGIQSQKVLVMDDETTAYSQEYAIMSSSDLLVSVGATIKSGNVELWFTPESGVSGIVTYKFTRETII